MMHVYWLSFTDPSRTDGDQFLGVVVLDAENSEDAVMRAFDLGCFPGGNVKVTLVPDDLTDESEERLARTPFGVLMDRSELVSRRILQTDDAAS